jgi:hypothetical protein|tara:strand:- start:440 stop:667 length:228 start_codon:yes stop_codon:yes gene_type:complete
MEELHGHTLEYWKNNAEEDYLKVPISVLKYITCLEERIEQLTIPVVVSTLPNECGILKNINGCDKGSGCRYPNCV